MSDSKSSSTIWFNTINLALAAAIGAAALAWAIKAYNIGVASLHASTLANQLALVQACQQSNGVSSVMTENTVQKAAYADEIFVWTQSLNSTICATFLSQFNANLAAIAVTVAKGNATFIDILPISPSAPKQHQSLSIGVEIGAIVAAVFGSISVVVALAQWRWSLVERRHY